MEKKQKKKKKTLLGKQKKLGSKGGKRKVMTEIEDNDRERLPSLANKNNMAPPPPPRKTSKRMNYPEKISTPPNKKQAPLPPILVKGKK